MRRAYEGQDVYLQRGLQSAKNDVEKYWESHHLNFWARHPAPGLQDLDHAIRYHALADLVEVLGNFAKKR